MNDCIEPVALLVALALLVAWWLALGIRDRRRNRHIDLEVLARWDALKRSDELVIADRACGDIWTEGETWCVCTRPHEHTGPCLDDKHGVIRR
ncbi:hypothetical protein [Microbacterium sp. TPU 3598]|uniref:hypothetical protein n=1 Tax=Microbacterium sp. TPU 3598 TaxID=1938334 RepID=UPI000BBB1C40|nr:hypothetical protein [Microbacterium sp. TPU 3598]